MNGEKIECSHEGCLCIVAAPLDPALGSASEAYCSEDCSEADAGSAAAGAFDGACTCGHPNCDAAA